MRGTHSPQMQQHQSSSAAPWATNAPLRLSRLRGQISGNVLLISVQPASQRGQVPGVYPGLALAAEVSLKVTAAVAVAVVAQ